MQYLLYAVGKQKFAAYLQQHSSAADSLLETLNSVIELDGKLQAAATTNTEWQLCCDHPDPAQ